MGVTTILLADNDIEYVQSLRWHIEQEGYKVVEAHSPEEAIQTLQRGEVDLAILDIRMSDDRDGKDQSGLAVAAVAPIIPKIMLTNFPSYESVRNVLGTRVNGPSLATDYVTKNDSIERLLLTINRVVSKLRIQELDAQYSGADMVRQQVRIFFWLSVIAASVGTGFLLISVWLVQQGTWQAGVLGVAMGVLLQGMSLLVYQRLDIANQRMERLEVDLRKMQHMEQLLQACDEMSSEAERDDCVRSIIDANTSLLHPESDSATASSVEPTNGHHR